MDVLHLRRPGIVNADREAPNQCAAAAVIVKFAIGYARRIFRHSSHCALADISRAARFTLHDLGKADGIGPLLPDSVFFHH